MGGGGYSRDVGSSSSSRGFTYGGTSSARAKKVMSRDYVHKDTSPYQRTIKSDRKSPIVIALDVTGSNKEFARIVYDKAPMLHGQIEQQGYLEDFDICFTAIGDAYVDLGPLQVNDFDHGIALDGKLKNLYLESGGGGQRMESYELAAHYFANKCDMPNAEMPFLFIIGDEAPYPYLDRSIAKLVLGEYLTENLDSKAIFDELFKKFNNNVFFLQNLYCSQYEEETEEIKDEWVKILGPKRQQNVIRVHEEKSVIDLILGIVAMGSKTRDMESYKTDMKDREQTDSRIKNVEKSLEGLAGLPDAAGAKKSGGRRL